MQVYARLVESYRAGRVPWKQATTFNLDEYVGLGSEHSASYGTYMRHHLFDHVDCPVERRHIPDGLAQDIAAEAAAYDQAIAAAGGMDFLLLGLGRNAHIGFNEPGSDFASRTRAVDLTPSTIAANAQYFSLVATPPTRAISMGIGTILEARSIIVLATGTSKAEAVRRMVNAPHDRCARSGHAIGRQCHGRAGRRGGIGTLRRRHRPQQAGPPTSIPSCSNGKVTGLSFWP